MAGGKQSTNRDPENNHAVTMLAINGLNTRFEDFMASVDKRDEYIHKNIESIASEFKALNGKVSATIKEVNDIKQKQGDLEKAHKACPVKLVQDDVTEMQGQISVWVFITKNWRLLLVSLALFAGVLIATYSAVSNMLNRVQQERIENIIDAYEEGGVKIKK